MKITHLKLQGLQLITPQIFRDVRGFFFESHRQDRYASHGLENFVQDNTSFSLKNTVRALHFQSQPGQVKLVTCLQGKIYDVVVDIRPDSPTFMQWEGIILDDESRQQIYIPIGFAHGFCVLSETALVQYKVSAPYNPATEMSIRWNDPDLAIQWPIDTPLLSPRDQTSPFFKEVFRVLDHRR